MVAINSIASGEEGTITTITTNSSNTTTEESSPDTASLACPYVLPTSKATVRLA